MNFKNLSIMYLLIFKILILSRNSDIEYNLIPLCYNSICTRDSCQSSAYFQWVLQENGLSCFTAMLRKVYGCALCCWCCCLCDAAFKDNKQYMWKDQNHTSGFSCLEIKKKRESICSSWTCNFLKARCVIVAVFYCTVLCLCRSVLSSVALSWFRVFAILAHLHFM